MQLFLGGVFIMKYCQNCGAQLDEKAVVCPKCGVPVAGATMSGVTPPPNAEPKPSAGWGFLGFFFPIVGWILYFVFHKETPKRAHRCAVWAWVGFAVQIVWWIIYVAVVDSAYPY